MAQKQSQGDVIRSFTLGNKELEGKTVEFQYDRGQYCIMDIVGEEKSIVYKSRNAQEAYTKWNVYIGRKKERPERSDRAENAQDSAPNEDRPHGRNKENFREDNRGNDKEHVRQDKTERENRQSRSNEGDNNRGRNHDKREERKNCDNRKNDRSNHHRGNRRGHGGKQQENA